MKDGSDKKCVPLCLRCAAEIPAVTAGVYTWRVNIPPSEAPSPQLMSELAPHDTTFRLAIGAETFPWE